MSSKFLDQSVVNREANIRVYNERIDNTLTLAGAIAQPNNTVQQGNTATPPITTQVTFNSPYGVIRTATIGAGDIPANNSVLIEVFNSLVTPQTVVLVSMVKWDGLIGTNGLPLIDVIVPDLAGQFNIVISNLSGVNALTGTFSIYFELREQIF